MSNKVRKDEGLQQAQFLAAKLDPDPAHSVHVCALASQLFDATTSVHGLNLRERLLLQAAALLHDTGHSVDPLIHHKKSRDIILASKLTGYTKNEMRIVACIARYHRKAHPKPDHKIYRDLDPEAQEVVRRLAALLRIADGLDRSHTSSARSLHFETTDLGFRIVVTQCSPNDTDLGGANRKRGLFEEVFGKPVEIAGISAKVELKVIS
ncbi:MAG: HD domain-containing protein [Candidatus Hydrogenedentes bacterium]|nr:HD domain-containing protein [Candidatus Hydrogenedentota bacterium]